jgi:hypothetical protein
MPNIERNPPAFPFISLYFGDDKGILLSKYPATVHRQIPESVPIKAAGIQAQDSRPDA